MGLDGPRLRVYTRQEVTMLLTLLLACSDGTVTSAETFDWYTDDVTCAGNALWRLPDPPPMLASARVVHTQPDATYRVIYTTLNVGGAANGGEDIATIGCDEGDTVTVTYAVRADTE